METDVFARSCKILQGGSDKIQLILLKHPETTLRVATWIVPGYEWVSFVRRTNDCQWYPMMCTCWFLCFQFLPDCIRRQNLAQQANPWAASAIESILVWIFFISLSESWVRRRVGLLAAGERGPRHRLRAPAAHRERVWALLGTLLDTICAFFLDSALRLKDRFGGWASAGQGRGRDSPHQQDSSNSEEPWQPGKAMNSDAQQCIAMQDSWRDRRTEGTEGIRRHPKARSSYCFALLLTPCFDHSASSWWWFSPPAQAPGHKIPVWIWSSSLASRHWSIRFEKPSYAISMCIPLYQSLYDVIYNRICVCITFITEKMRCVFWAKFPR